MKIQIEITESKKVIRVTENITLGKLIDELEKSILPNGTWKGFELETNSEIIWKDPIFIESYVWTPVRYPSIMYGNCIGKIGTYSIEIV